MARPLKEGLTYFSHDVDMSDDQKILRLESIHGIVGYGTYNKLLERVYATPHGELDLSNEIDIIVLAKKFRISSKKLMDILKSCMTFGLFDTAIWNSKKIITSNGIKKRFVAVETERERKRKWKLEQKTKPNDDIVDGENIATSSNNDNENIATSSNNDGKLTSTEPYKVKESKVNKSKPYNNTVSKDTDDKNHQEIKTLDDLKIEMAKLDNAKTKVAFLGELFKKLHKSAVSEHDRCYGRIGNICKNYNYDYDYVLTTIFKTQDSIKQIDGRHLDYIEGVLRNNNGTHNINEPTTRGYEHVN